MRHGLYPSENPAMTRKYPLPRGQPPLFAGNASNDGNAIQASNASNHRTSR